MLNFYTIVNSQNGSIATVNTPLCCRHLRDLIRPPQTELVVRLRKELILMEKEDTHKSNYFSWSD